MSPKPRTRPPWPAALLALAACAAPRPGPAAPRPVLVADAPVICPGGRPPPCPSDQDADGFPDASDRCPDEPGRFDGCPFGDRDGDGLRDDQDRCPDQPAEDRRDWFDGCPDSDDDYVSDPDDACPGEKENLNGFQDRDGCPDELPKRITDALRPYHYTLREYDATIEKKRLSPGMRRALARVAAMLREYPEIRLEIRSHADSTDNRGSPYYWRGRYLVLVRIARLYLVEQEGIDPARLELSDAGPSEPIDTNRTAAGRAKNRRLEFTILVD